MVGEHAQVHQDDEHEVARPELALDGLAGRLVDPKRGSPFLCTLVRSGCTVLVMCPAMSLVASILFNVVLAGASPVQLPAIWVRTLIKNFPMALPWNLFVAGPVSRLLFAKLFSRVGER